jgi:hypothetical protein
MITSRRTTPRVTPLLVSRPFLLQQADKELFQQQTQFYLLTENPHSQLLDSHQLFTQPFMNNPLLPFSTLMDKSYQISLSQKLIPLWF